MLALASRFMVFCWHPRGQHASPFCVAWTRKKRVYTVDGSGTERESAGPGASACSPPPPTPLLEQNILEVLSLNVQTEPMRLRGHA